MSLAVLILLRLVHILTSVFWVGATLFMARFLLPTVRELGPAAGPVMDQIIRVRRLPVAMMSATILSIISGLFLLRHDSAQFAGGWFRSGTGMTFGAGAALGLLAAILGMAIISPTAKRLGDIAGGMKGGSPASEQLAEMKGLQARLGTFSMLNVVLLLLATAAMATARYVP